MLHAAQWRGGVGQAAAASAARSSSAAPAAAGTMRAAAPAAAAGRTLRPGAVPSRTAAAGQLPGRRLQLACRAAEEEEAAAAGGGDTASLDKQLSKLTRQTASTFAPRASGKTGKNPAVRGSPLYAVFEYQAWLALAVGGLLSFNVLWPTDGPAIPRLLGMWSIWMFTIPSLRARECAPREKDALNLLFVAVPLLNVLLPFVYKSFGFIFVADAAAVAGVYAWKGVWAEVYGLPLGASAPPAAVEGVSAEAAGGEPGEQQQ